MNVVASVTNVSKNGLFLQNVQNMYFKFHQIFPNIKYRKVFQIVFNYESNIFYFDIFLHFSNVSNFFKRFKINVSNNLQSTNFKFCIFQMLRLCELQ